MTIKYIDTRPMCEFAGYSKKNNRFLHVYTKIKGTKKVPMFECVREEQMEVNVNKRNMRHFHKLFSGEFDDILL